MSHTTRQLWLQTSWRPRYVRTSPPRVQCLKLPKRNISWFQPNKKKKRGEKDKQGNPPAAVLQTSWRPRYPHQRSSASSYPSDISSFKQKKSESRGQTRKSSGDKERKKGAIQNTRRWREKKMRSNLLFRDRPRKGRGKHRSKHTLGVDGFIIIPLRVAADPVWTWLWVAHVWYQKRRLGCFDWMKKESARSSEWIQVFVWYSNVRTQEHRKRNVLPFCIIAGLAGQGGYRFH